MINRILEFSLRQRPLVLLGALALLLAGLWFVNRLPIDAVPDITSTQVQINTEVKNLAPEEIEKLVTFPIEMEMSGIPGAREMRSLSKFGLSQITIVFEDSADIYRARQLVAERLANAAESLPPGLAPKLAPITTGLGEIYYYVVDYKHDAAGLSGMGDSPMGSGGSGGMADPAMSASHKHPEHGRVTHATQPAQPIPHSALRTPHSPIPATRPEQLMELKLLHDQVIKPALRAVPGIAEVNASGGYEKQILVYPRPDALLAAGITTAELADIIAANTENAGGGAVQIGAEQIIIRADSRVQTTDDIARLPVKFRGLASRPLLVSDLAEVAIGSSIRTGSSTHNGREAVLGSALMLTGENPRIVARRIAEKIDELRPRLPDNVEIITVYDRTELVDRTINTVAHNLTYGAIFVVVVLLLLLGNIRAALIVSLAIPLSFLFAITGMVETNLSGNLMSLGAVDFGLIIDGAVVMVENIVRRLGLRQHEIGRPLNAAERNQTVLSAAKEVGRPAFFGVLIITIVYIPLLSLTGIEGKTFKPMALTVIYALIGAIILTLTLMPVLSSHILRGNISHKDNLVIRALKAAYRPLLAVALRLRWLIVAASIALFALAAHTFKNLGAEFIPQLDEGSFATHMIRTTSIGLDASVAMQEKTEQIIHQQFPGITTTFSRIGTQEVATDPMGVNVADTYIFFKPFDQWPAGSSGTGDSPVGSSDMADPAMRSAHKHPEHGRVAHATHPVPTSKSDLAAQLTAALETAIPGQAYLFSQPIQMRFNEILEGTRADIAVKVFGDDYDQIEHIATEAREILEAIPGAADVEFDSLGKSPLLEIKLKPDAMARYNIHASELNAAVETALAGADVGTVIEGNRRIPIVVRVTDDIRSRTEEILRIPLRAESPDTLLTLGQVADLVVTEKVAAITRESGQRRAAIMVNLRGRDVESYVREAQQKIAAEIKLPPGYTIEFGGSFQNLQQARARLAIIVPAALAIIFVLIFIAFGSLRQALLVYTGIPLAVTGGVFALWLRDMPFSISAGVGFIALSGVAVLNGLMMVSHFNTLRAEGLSVRDTAIEGALTRLRPVLMTALVASLGFLPMALATGPGAEVQRPLATVVIGGIITATFLTLILLPALYDTFEKKQRPESR
ncbi:cobalt-zinc-cadmium resistance protein CzcA [Ereboglobus sp. PH5-10]|uniref:efflux RND transporter permease subunit n=1 Tax=Ereboglobus sp. PH5-10 TaxID=2940629 RepID=UPI002407130B|nr:CusA/CzcA family heavy metal efflux RND transporter [Ereboglobus sp. PH5-10]MDF9826043.1 cobalt-zinc-cadmium resistance protein CzcA [Ereboglobus sp. PH5-10]